MVELIWDSSLDKIASGIEPLSNSRFIHIEYQERGELKEAWVYPEPLKVPKDMDFARYSDIEGAIHNLNFPEQLLLQNRVKEKLGIDLRHGSLKENFIALHSKETKDYVEGVLNRHWLYTGEIARKQDSIRRVIGINLVKEQVAAEPIEILIDEKGKEIPPKQIPMKEIIQIQYIAGEDLKVKLPTKEGYFHDFEIFPTDKDFISTSEPKGHWRGTRFDVNLLSTVHCERYLSSPKKLSAGSDLSSSKTHLGAIPIWTDENPKK